MKLFLNILLVVLLIPSNAIAEYDSRLYGNWRSIKIEGGLCVEMVKSIKYEFDQDGYYKIDSVLYSHGKTLEQSAEGTYETKDGLVTGDVKGQKIGPFKYWFKDSSLVIEQTEPFCLIYLQNTSTSTNMRQ